MVGRSKGEPVSPEIACHRERRASRKSAKASVVVKELVTSSDELFGDTEDDMPGRRTQRKHGTTRWSPRRSRTAKALRISRIDGEIVMCRRVGRMGSRKRGWSWDRRTRTGARTPGVEQRRLLEWRCATDRSPRHRAGKAFTPRSARRKAANRGECRGCRELA